MSDKTETPRPARREFQSRVRLALSGMAEVEERLAANLSQGGLFVRDDHPPPVGTLVALEIVLPDGSCLGRFGARVAHARPAVTPGEPTAGMGLEFLELDKAAEALVARLRREGPATPEPAPARGPVRDVIARPERAPLVGLPGPVVGIDLGTANSCVAVVTKGRPQVVSTTLGYQLVPSVVVVNDDGSVLVGHRAVEKMILAPGRAIYGWKRFLGRPYASQEVRTLGHFFPYELVPGADGRVAARVGGRVITLEEVGSHVLRTLRVMAEEKLGQPVQRAVIGVPAYFGETQRQAVRDAGRLAGLYVERIVNEPTCAAVAFGWHREGLGTAAIYDLGGGTFDAAVVRVDGPKIDVLASDGDPFLGGNDFDDRLTEYVLMRFERLHGVSLRQDPVAVQRVRYSVEMAKRQLSETLTADVRIPYVCKTDKGLLDLEVRLDRDTLETLTHDLVERTFALFQGVLDQLHLHASQVDEVLLVGGQTRSPHVRRLLEQRFGRKPSAAVHPEEAVALGAAIIADAVYSHVPLLVSDLLPASIRVARVDGGTDVLFERGARLPISAEIELESLEGFEREYRVSLYRGEHDQAAENTVVGTVRLPSSHALALSGLKARATVAVSVDGLLTVEVRHPLSGQAQQLEVSLVP